jgi:hypothetical protein
MKSEASSSCPGEEEISALGLDEMSEPRRTQLRAHVATCERCAFALADYEGLAASIREAELPGYDAHVRSVVERVRETPQDALPRPGQLVLRRVSIGITLAVAAALLIRFRMPREDVVSRGAGSPPARVCHLEGATCAPVVGGEGLDKRLRFALESESRGKVRPYGVAFVVDVRGEIHWVFPPWTGGPPPDPARLPEGLSRDAVQFPDMVPGRANAFVLTSDSVVEVARIEAVPVQRRTETGFRALFPEARLSAVAFSLTP